jgi:hypothetical protein
MILCVGCGVNRVAEEEHGGPGPAFCSSCQKHYPASLRKAVADPFDYALRLVTGEVIRFTSAHIQGDYIHLSFGNQSESDNALPFVFARGIEVRADAIVWCADAPEGS